MDYNKAWFEAHDKGRELSECDMRYRCRGINYLTISSFDHEIEMIGPDGKDWKIGLVWDGDWIIDCVKDHDYESDPHGWLIAYFDWHLGVDGFVDFMDSELRDFDDIVDDVIEQPRWSSKREEVI